MKVDMFGYRAIFVPISSRKYSRGHEPTVNRGGRSKARAAAMLQHRMRECSSGVRHRQNVGVRRIARILRRRGMAIVLRDAADAALQRAGARASIVNQRNRVYLISNIRQLRHR